MNNRRRITGPRIGLAGLFSVLLACLQTGCQGPLVFQDPKAARSTPTWRSQSRFGHTSQVAGGNAQTAAPFQDHALRSGFPARPSPRTQAPLLSWDGGVALAAPEGQTRMADPVPDHGLEPELEGRMHILNLYQDVLDERDSLLAEVQRLGTALQSSEAEKEQVRSTESEVSMHVAALEEAKRSLLEQNQDLASRLTLAQIRRLESEKLLLETQIAWHRDRTAMHEKTGERDALTAMAEK